MALGENLVVMKPLSHLMRVDVVRNLPLVNELPGEVGKRPIDWTILSQNMSDNCFVIPVEKMDTHIKKILMYTHPNWICNSFEIVLMSYTYVQ